MAEVRDESYWCQQVFDRFELSVVRLKSGRSEGNGFIVHAGDGGTNFLILTCAHILGPVQVGGTIAACFSGSNDRYDATLLYADNGLDLALLRARGVVAPGRVTPLRFFDAEVVSGWNVVALSFIALGVADILEPGTFSGKITNQPDNAYLKCSCSSQPGTSGSPIILAGVNEVVAVLAGSSLACVDAIGVGTIRQFLGGWLGSPNLTFPTNGLVALAAAKP